MHRHDRKHIDFITQFVDSVTIRPFFDDLRRVSAAGLVKRSRPQHSEATPEAA